MSTYADLVNRVRYLLRSYTGLHEVSTHLTAAITDTDLAIPVADGNATTTGIVEIDDELVWVDSSTGGTLNIPPYGRGYGASTAAAHADGTQVIADPTFPRSHIADALLDTQRALYPTLWRPATLEFTASAAVSTYDLAATTDRILSVSWQVLGPSGYWKPVRRWRLDRDANTTSYPSGNALTLLEPVGSGQTVRVVYAAPFTEFSAPADTLADCGHQPSHFDLLAIGATWRLVQFVEVSRLDTRTVENQERAKFAAPGAASALTRQLLALYERRLDEERDRLRQLHPISLHYNR